MKVECSLCHKMVEDKQALVNTDEAGKQRILCRDCFKKEAGVDYQTFSYRKENAKTLTWSVLFCIAMTIYAFWEKGPLYGVMGIMLTVLIYYFGCKVKR